MITMRSLGRTVILAVILAAAPAAPLACGEGVRPAAPPRSTLAATTTMAPASVASFRMNVLDLDRELAFLRSLDLTVIGERPLAGPAFDQLVGAPSARAREVTLALGASLLVLTQFSTPVGRDVEVGRANDAGFQHIAIVVRDMDAAYARLARTPMRPVSPSPQTLPASNPVAAGIRAVYFRDPEGHFLELLQFPADKGDPKWHRPTEQVFLGIDHSAIVTASTERSLHFYRDVLGMHVASESLNEGREQELLSGVAGARVHITSLHGASGPGVELLEYLAPRDGKPFPPSTAADSVSTQIALEVDSVEATLDALGRAWAGASSAPGGRYDALVRDPDGHTIRLSERTPNDAARPRP